MYRVKVAILKCSYSKVYVQSSYSKVLKCPQLHQTTERFPAI